MSKTNFLERFQTHGLNLPDSEQNKAIDYDIAKGRNKVFNNPRITKEHLDRALTNSKWTIRAAAVESPFATKEQLDKAFDDEESAVRARICLNPNATKEHLDRAFNDPDPQVIQSSFMNRNPNATKERLIKALNSPYDSVRYWANDLLKRGRYSK